MILDEQQVDERLKSPDNLVNRFGIRQMPDSPSNLPTVPAPDSAKIDYPSGHFKNSHLNHATQAIPNINFPVLARMNHELGLPASQVRSLLPLTERLSEQLAASPESEDLVEQTENHIRDRAHEVLNRTFDHMTDDKLAACNGAQLAGIAANISKVAANVTSKGHIGDGVKLIVYAPQMRQERQYETLDVTAS